MLKIRISITWLLTMAFVPGILAAQYNRDAGEYVILSGSIRHGAPPCGRNRPP